MYVCVYIYIYTYTISDSILYEGPMGSMTAEIYIYLSIVYCVYNSFLLRSGRGVRTLDHNQR